MVLLLALLVASLVPVAGSADDTGAGCGSSQGSTWAGSAQCHFLWGGSPLVAEATARAPDGTARVSIEVFTSDGLVLTGCEASAPGEASCRSQLGPDPQVRIPGAVGVIVYCHVEGELSGTYWCQSGLGW